MALTTVSTITDLPAAPQKGESEDTFTTKANAFVSALVTMENELNVSIGELNTLSGELDTLGDTVQTNKDATDTNVTSSAASAALAADWANEDVDVVVSGAEYSAKHYSIKSEGFKDSAETAAAAAQAAAGLPSLAGAADYALIVNSAEDGVEWADIALPVGSIVLGPQAVNANWLLADGAIHTKATYPTLGALLDGKYKYDNAPVENNIAGTAVFNGIAYDGSGVYVAVGDGDLIRRSTDGVTWTTENSGLSVNFESVHYGNGLFVACGTKIATSPDGITWTERTNPGTMSQFDGVYANSTHILVGNQGNILKSADGVTWTEEAVTGMANNYGINFVNGLFIVMGSDSHIFTSPDGSTWTEQNPSGGTFDTRDAMRVAYGNGVYVVRGSAGLVMVSADAITWSIYTLPDADTGLYATLVFQDGYFVTTYDHTGGKEALAISTDGVEWIVISENAGTYQFNDSMTDGATVFLVNARGSVYNLDERYDPSTEFSLPNIPRPSVVEFPQVLNYYIRAQ